MSRKYVIHCKFLGPTNTRGARISVWGEHGRRRIYAYDHAARRPMEDAAIRYALEALSLPCYGSRVSEIECEKGIYTFLFEPKENQDG